MTIKPLGLALSALLLLSACADHEQADPHDHAGDTALVYTHYTEASELFVEFPPLVVGHSARLLAHFTNLADYSPVTHGTVDAALQKDGNTLARFRVSAPTRDGLFTPTVTPRDAGAFNLIVTLRHDGQTAIHDLGPVTVFPSADAVDVHQPEPEGDISYLKEQQWQNPFATSLASHQPLRPSVPGYAEVMAPADAGADIPAPADGYMAAIDLIRAGDTVASGDVLGYLVPRLGEGADLGEARVALQRARSQLQLSEQELQRTRNLVTQGAIPERRLQEAQQTYAIAQAEWKAAQARIEQRQSGNQQAGLALRAPVAGQVIEVRAQPGAFVRAGERVFRIAAPDRRWLHVQIPEHLATDLHTASGAWFELPRQDSRLLDESTGAKVVQVMTAIEPVTRTAGITLEYPSTAGPTLIGSRFTAQVYIGAPEQRLAIPRSALVDDGGQQVVYVQSSGETFARRPVQTGVIDGPQVEVVAGIQAGERVVSRGAYYVKLASAGGDEIGHGHAH